MKQFTVTGTHSEIGHAIGQQFAAQIHQFLDAYPFMQRLLAFHNSAEGQARYQQYLAINQQHFPAYMLELEAIAHGANRPFHHLFLVNMRGEYRDYLNEHELFGCSDVAVVTNDNALIGHNEDGDIALADTAYLVQVSIPNQPSFTSFSYPGFLCGNALGFNRAGICFSVDNVQPRNIEIGLVRHFIARSLLAATSLDDAIARATVAGRAGGFSYTIGSIHERRIVIVETAPHQQHVREIKGIFYHANQYVGLEMDQSAQSISKSSMARSQRAQELLQNKQNLDHAGILEILTDRKNTQLPICRIPSATDNTATICTTIFDLDRQRFKLYPGPISKFAPIELAL